MPFANNNGIRIRYEVVGKGPPVVLYHGMTDGLECWIENGYVDGLKDDYQLILMDSRGHGQSDKPHDPEAYRFKLLAEDVLAVMDAVKVPRAHFYGYSMGARVGWSSVKHNLHTRFTSLILGGDSPRAWLAPFADFIKNEGNAAWVGYLEEHFGALHPEAKARLMKNDPLAIYAICSWEWPDTQEILPTMTMPCLVYVGELDDMEWPMIKDVVAKMPSPTFFSLPNLDHFATHVRSDLVLPRVREFLAKASR